MTTTKTIAEVATEALKHYEWKEDRKTYVSKNDWPDWVRDMTYEAHDGMLPDDYKYNFIVETLEMLQDCETEEQAQDRFSEIESDIYTNDLTAWLASNNSRLEYLSDVLENYGMKDGFSALSQAQIQEREEVAHCVLKHILNQVEA